MSLGSTQREFTRDIAELILYAYSIGYELTVGDFYRDPRSHGEMGVKKAYGRSESAHKQRLAADLNLFIDSAYLTDTEAHRPLGDYWKGLHPDNRWGGDFSSPDGNHYSRKYGGIA